MKKLYKFYVVAFAALVLSACNSYHHETYQEPQQGEPMAKVTFAKSNNYGKSYGGTFYIHKYEGSFMNKTSTTISFDSETKNRNFGIPIPKGANIEYNVYVPADQKLSFIASVSKQWFTDINLTKTNRVSQCVYANTEFTPEKNGEYLVFVDDTREDTKVAPRCSLVIRQLIKGKSGNQWIDVDYKFNNNDFPVMSTREVK